MVNSTLGLRLAVIIVVACFASSLHGSTAAVRLEGIGTTWDPYGIFLYVFRLTNESAESISFEGYGPSAPAYSMQFRRLGGWKEERTGWCGVGLDSRRLAPGQSITFTVPEPEGIKTWRVGVQFSSDSRRTTAGKPALLIWSRPVSTSSVAGNRAARDASQLVTVDVIHDSSKEHPYTLTLTNVSSEPLFYGGFREPHVPPIYIYQYKYADGWHDEGSINWCGTDLRFRALHPGKSARFSILAPSIDRIWRGGIHFYRNAAPKTPADAFLPVWWPPLPPREKSTGSSRRSE